MKAKVIFTFVLLLALLSNSKTLSAQDTVLQVSKVVLYDIPGSGTQSFTVPANKVWRIESVSTGASSFAPSIVLENVSNQSIAFFASPVSTTSANYPFWLPAAFAGTLVNNNPSYRCSVSITEYNYTP